MPLNFWQTRSVSLVHMFSLQIEDDNVLLRCVWQITYFWYFSSLFLTINPKHSAFHFPPSHNSQLRESFLCHEDLTPSSVINFIGTRRKSNTGNVVGLWCREKAIKILWYTKDEEKRRLHSPLDEHRKNLFRYYLMAQKTAAQYCWISLNFLLLFLLYCIVRTNVVAYKNQRIPSEKNKAKWGSLARLAGLSCWRTQSTQKTRISWLEWE